jgi:hypothetical protein
VTPRTRDTLLLLAGLPGVVAPWMPYAGKFEGFGAAIVSISLALNFGPLQYMENWSDRLFGFLSALPFFLPIVITLWQWSRLRKEPPWSFRWTRISVTLAALLTVGVTIAILAGLPGNLRLANELAAVDHSSRPVVESVVVYLIFGLILVANLMLLVSAGRRANASTPSNTGEYALLATYLLVAVPFLTSSALDAVSPYSGHFLLVGYWLILWTCLVYLATIVIRLRDDSIWRARHTVMNSR